MRKSDNPISHVFLRNTLIVTYLAIAVLGVTLIEENVTSFLQDSSKIRNEHIAFQKATIKEVVEKAVDEINHWKSFQEKRSLKNGKEEIIEAIFHRLTKVTYGKNSEGFIFVGNFDGVELVNREYPNLVGINFWDMEDAFGVKIFQEEIRIAKTKPKGDFLKYWWSGKKSPKSAIPKISFVKGVKDWKLFVGAGMNLDEVDAVIAQKRSELKRHVKHSIIKIVLILIILSLIVFWLSKRMSNRAKKNIEAFTSFFTQSANEETHIDLDQVHYAEFVQLASSANLMIEERTKGERKRKLAEGALRESEKRFRDISHSLADWIWEVDKNGKYTYVSDTVEKILGYSPEELIGETPFELMTAEEAVKISEIFLEIASKSRPIVDLENWNIDKCGSEVCLLTNGVPILDADGELLGYRGVNKDITSQKKLEAEKTAIETRLQQAQKMESIGTLAGGIAHDFNNILGAILGYAQLAGMDLPENSKSHRHIEQILKASDRAKSLVGQILAFSRENKLEKIPVDIGIIVKEALKLLRASLPANIEIRQNVTSNLDTVMADQTQVHQIMMNLCTNALHAMERNGGLLEVVLVPVELKEEDAAAYPDIKPDRYLKLSVTDSGHGMDSATVSRIFDPYFTTKDIDEGTGLGLATVHGIVKGHGGIIKVYSEPGSGTSFQIYLPCIEDNVITEEKVSKPLSTGTEQILFLDDDKVLVDIGEKMLKKLGYRVNSRTSPYEALEAFKANPSKYDMVITDMTMPGMTGDILAKEILKIRYNIPIIICTGFSKMMSPEKASKMGIKDFLMKPLTMSDLSKSIRTVLDQN